MVDIPKFTKQFAKQHSANISLNDVILCGTATTYNANTVIHRDSHNIFPSSEHQTVANC